MRKVWLNLEANWFLSGYSWGKHCKTLEYFILSVVVIRNIIFVFSDRAEEESIIMGDDKNMDEEVVA